MAVKNIVVEGVQFSFDHGTGTVTVNSQPSTKCKCDGKGIYNEIKFSVAGYSGGAISQAGEGTGEFPDNSTKSKAGLKSIFFLGDESKEFQVSGPNLAGVIVTEIEKIKVIDAGQTKCRGS